mmetsp:Transcript_15210/g.45875  ORF Transcript_15210/g.45875 Transcript_15210/m.45875 type:complete len:439 (-) Transcript_15210:670-1986(-)
MVQLGLCEQIPGFGAKFCPSRLSLQRSDSHFRGYRTLQQLQRQGDCRTARRLQTSRAASCLGGSSAQAAHKTMTQPPGISISMASEQYRPSDVNAAATWPSGGLHRKWGAVIADSAAPPVQPSAAREEPQQLRVLTFNVLADGLDVNGGFVQADPAALPWSARQHLLMDEIVAAGAHIVCLQECNHFHDFFAPQLADLGYSGAFLAKGSSPANQYGCATDGCALFYRTDLLSALSGPEGLCFRDMNGGQAAQCLLMQRLACTRTGQQLVAATFHMKAKTGATNDSIRRSQAEQAALAVAACAARSSGHARNGAAEGSAGNGAQSAAAAPIVLSGDMNAEPGSAACEVLRDQPAQLHSLWDVDLKNPEGEGETFTTWKHRAEGTSRRIIDHIWYSAALKPTERWLTPSADAIGAAGLPSRYYGSDHLAVAASFEWPPLQ